MTSLRTTVPADAPNNVPADCDKTSLGIPGNVPDDIPNDVPKTSTMMPQKL